MTYSVLWLLSNFSKRRKNSRETWCLKCRICRAYAKSKVLFPVSFPNSHFARALTGAGSQGGTFWKETKTCPQYPICSYIIYLGECGFFFSGVCSKMGKHFPTQRNWFLVIEPRHQGEMASSRGRRWGEEIFLELLGNYAAHFGDSQNLWVSRFLLIRLKRQLVLKALASSLFWCPSKSLQMEQLP